MATKKYSSYAQIDGDLEILKLEKEIHYQKMILGIQKTKETLTPNALVSNIISSTNSVLSSPYGVLLKMATPFIINKAIPFVSKWFSKAKRGN